MGDFLLDIVNDDAFSTTELTRLVNDEDYAPGRISELEIFETVPVSTDKVQIEVLDGQFSIVPTAERGGPPSQQRADKATLHGPFKVPHIPLESTIAAETLQNLREPGQGATLRTVQAEVVRRLGRMARNIDGTREHKLIGALRGQILDADGSVLLDLFTGFGVTQETEIDFDLDNASPAEGAVKLKCNQVVRKIGDNLKNRRAKAILGLCGPGFYDLLTTHKEVSKAFERFTDNSTNGLVGAFLRDSQVRVPNGFQFGGIIWEEYRGGSDFIPDDGAIFFPIGVPDLYLLHHAPANFLEFVNTLGLPRYAKVWPTDNSGRSLTLHTQSNPLPLCTSPKVLMKARKT